MWDVSLVVTNSTENYFPSSAVHLILFHVIVLVEFWFSLTSDLFPAPAGSCCHYKAVRTPRNTSVSGEYLNKQQSANIFAITTL